MSCLACGLEAVNSHGPCWMPWVSFDPPPVKMSSVFVLTASVTKADAIAPLTGGGVTLLSAKTWSQSCVVVVVTLASSSNTLVTLGVTRFSSCSNRRRYGRRRVCCVRARARWSEGDRGVMGAYSRVRGECATEAHPGFKRATADRSRRRGRDAAPVRKAQRSPGDSDLGTR